MQMVIRLRGRMVALLEHFELHGTGKTREVE
jgi:hypothetical protein